jgi:hypothetical protein
MLYHMRRFVRFGLALWAASTDSSTDTHTDHIPKNKNCSKVWENDRNSALSSFFTVRERIETNRDIINKFSTIFTSLSEVGDVIFEEMDDAGDGSRQLELVTARAEE